MSHIAHALIRKEERSRLRATLCLIKNAINIGTHNFLSFLFAGQSHELHPPSDKHPAIVVHICEDSSDPDMNQPPKIIQTRRPP